MLSVRSTLLIAFAVIAMASTGRAQNAPPPQVRPPLEGWYGEMTWSFHHKEDTSAPADHSRSETKSDGEATIRVQDIGGGRLIGLLEGSQKVDTIWTSSPYARQVCRGSAPPTRVWARVTGSPTPGSNAPALQLVDLHAEIQTTWGGGPNCGEMPPFDVVGGSLSALLRGLQPVGDGTYKAEFHTIAPLLEVHWSLVLRPGYCGYGTDRGGLFAFGATGASAKIHASPAAASPSVSFAPNGSRLLYNRVMQVDGQTWFHVSPPGKPAGWVSSADVACRRPYEPPPLRPAFPGYSMESYRGTACACGGARG